MANPRPTPTALKLLRGNPGQRKLNPKEPRLVAETPKAPPHLTGKEAKAEWRRITKILADVGVLSKIDGLALALYCDAHAAYVQAKREIEQSGFTVLTHNGSPVQRPAVAVMHRCRADMLKLLAEFGMTPASRTKITVLETERDELDEFLCGESRAS